SYVLADVDASSGGPGGMAALMAAAGKTDDSAPAPTAPTGPVKGKLTVAARAEGFVLTKSAAFDVEGGVPVTAPTIQMSRGATLAGRVRDEGGGAVVGAKVEVTKDPTDADPMQS